jgi:phage terminase small subunit
VPVLSNPKHERFAQELAKGSSASAAYVVAGYSKSETPLA